MNKSIIDQALTNLTKQRPVFCSEADFQFAFSEVLRVYLPNAKIRLERPFPVGKGKYYHVDLWVEDEGKIYPIELKYKTKKCNIIFDDGPFLLKDQSAEDLGRYDYIADIKRIENIKVLRPETFGEGYAIMLTNDASYYDPQRQHHKPTIDSDFRIYDGVNLTGLLRWKPTPNSKIPVEEGDRGSRKAITLSGNYPIKWTMYREVPDNKGKTFEIKQCVTIIKR